jgi:hypothetical protein
MSMYLKVLGLTGKKGEARQFTNISPGTIAQWRKYNIDGFRDRELDAMVTACDNLEDLLWEHAYAGNPSAAQGLLGALKADLYAQRGRSQAVAAAIEDESVTPIAVARELRNVWEELGEFCPSPPSNGSGGNGALPSSAGKTNGSGE